jgi:hypothetical protein
MRTEEEFKIFYENELRERLKKMEVLREPARKTIRARNRIGAAIVMVFVFLYITWFTGIPIAIIYGFYNYTIYRKHHMLEGQLLSSFKKEIIESIISFISETLTYQPERGITSYEYMESQFTKETSLSCYHDDLVTGKIDGIPIRFSELTVYYKDDESEDKLFKGMFIVSEFSKDFEGCVMLFTHTIDLMKTHKQLKERKRIQLEDSEFNQVFHCFADNDITARYILSASLKARLILFVKKIGKYPVRISFVDGKLFIGIARSKSFFEPVLSKPLDNYEEALTYFREISLATGIVQDLNLTNRIWTKE